MTNHKALSEALDLDKKGHGNPETQHVITEAARKYLEILPHLEAVIEAGDKYAENWRPELPITERLVIIGDYATTAANEITKIGALLDE